MRSKAATNAMIFKTIKPTKPNDAYSLVGCDLGSGNNVALEVVVDVGSVTRVGALDVARDLRNGRRVARATTGDLELSAGDVELRWGSRVVDTELLDAEQVVSGGDLAGDID